MQSSSAWRSRVWQAHRGMLFRETEQGKAEKEIDRAEINRVVLTGRLPEAPWKRPQLQRVDRKEKTEENAQISQSSRGDGEDDSWLEKQVSDWYQKSWTGTP